MQSRKTRAAVISVLAAVAAVSCKTSGPSLTASADVSGAGAAGAAGGASDYLRVMTYRSYVGFDWSNPKALSWSLVENGAAFSVEHNIGHLDVEVHCLADNHGGQESDIFAGQTGGLEMGNKLLEGDGLGMIVYSYKGSLYDETAVKKSLSIGVATKNRLATMTFKIPPATCDRLSSYFHTYQSEQIYSRYGMPNRPRYKEGAGCSAFGTSFVELAGLLDPDTKSKWATLVRVPTVLIGNLGTHVSDLPLIQNIDQDYRLQKVDVDTLAGMSPADKAARLNKYIKLNTLTLPWFKTESRWATADEAHVPVSFYDPDKVYAWIMQQRQQASQAGTDLTGHPAEVNDMGYAPGVTIDRRDVATPSDPIFKDVADQSNMATGTDAGVGTSGDTSTGTDTVSPDQATGTGP